jgi:hypothetical protein
MFSSCQNKGFHITFGNGVTISVQFGPGNYCEKRGEDFRAPESTSIWSCEHAEVAILLPDGRFYPIQDCDDVIGWQTADDVAKWIEFARNLIV